MLSAIVFLPLFGALIAGLGGRFIGARPAEVVTTGFLMLAAALSWVALVQIGMGEHDVRVQVLTWMSVGDFHVDWALRFDTLTAVMCVVVNTVSSLVHLYSIGYMADDPHRPRFFAYLSLFTFAMLMLVTADNFVQMFFGWEGVGLASYLLIGFWYQKPEANAAAIKAFVVNRVGDFGFALGIVGVFAVYGTVGFDDVFAATPELAGKTFADLAESGGHSLGLLGPFADWDVLTTLCLLLFVGACGKSAQFLLHTWLPDAMEGPTPVSALIHAATMVTAGVFLVCRCSPMFEYAPDALNVVAIVGAITAFFAATVGMFQNDIKRVIAYSTCSQLGYMFFAAGLGAYPAAMFHLFTHAFFKALLFLGAGAVIHSLHHEQDMRRMGGLARYIPVTYAAMLIGTLALTGFGIPHVGGTAGFYSKDAIIETAYAAGAGPGYFAFILGISAALMTSFYSWRLAFMTFHGEAKWKNASHHGDDAHDAHAALMHDGDVPEAHGEHAHHHGGDPHPPGLTMTIPLVVLSIGALIAGIVFYPYFIGKKMEEFWRESIFMIDPHHNALHMRHDVPEWVLWAPLAVSLIGLLIAVYYYILRPDLPPKMAARNGLLYRFIYNKWYFDEIYDFLFVRPTLWIGRKLWKLGDGWLIDGFGPDGVASAVRSATGRIVRLQSGYIFHYALAMLLGLAGLVTWLTTTWGGK